MSIRAIRARSGAAGGFTPDNAGNGAADIWNAPAAVQGAVALPVTPTLAGTGSSYDIVTLETGGAASVAFSPDETRIYVSKYDGNVDVFDAQTRVKIATWDVGIALGGLSLSEDGSFLMVVEKFYPPYDPNNPNPPPQTTSSTFCRVDTTTGAVTPFIRGGSPYADVEIVDDRFVILTGGQQQVSRFDLLTQAYTVLPGAVDYSNTSVLVEDERYTLFAEPGISSGPLLLYDDQTGTIVARGDNYQTIGQGSGQTGFNFGHQAISEAGGLVAQFIYYNTINLFDLNLDFIRGIQIAGPVDGLAFDPTGKFIFTRANTQFDKIDIATGAVVDTFIVMSASPNNTIGSGDQIVLSEDGKILLVKDNAEGGLQLIDLRLRDELFEGTAGADALAGGKGDDTYIVNHAGDTITELLYDGTDLAIASIDYTLPLYVENLNLTGNAYQGTGNALANRIVGTNGANLLAGMAGNDTYSVDSADRVVEAAGGGSDYIVAQGSFTLEAGSEVELVSTTNNGDMAAIDFTGNEYGQALVGNAGANRLDGGAGGADVLVGLGGNDTYIVDGDDRVVEAVGGGSDYIAARSSFVLDASAEVELISTTDNGGAAAINLTGSASAHVLVGNEGANVLNGGGGADTLVGLGGNDTYIVDADDRVVEAAGGGSDYIAITGSFILEAGSSVELISTTDNGGTAAVNLNGNALAQVLVGNAGANSLDGGGGADVLVGLGGNDSYVVDGDDRVVEAVSGGSDYIAARSSFVLEAGSSVELISTTDNGGTAAIDLTGSIYAQVLVGNSGANRLDGGGGGADTLVGLGGDDTYIVDADDRVIEAAGGGADYVVARTGYTLEAGAAVELLSTADNNGGAAINLTGNELAQSVIGNAGSNFLDGKGGADFLLGLGGADSFSFTSALGGGNIDRIGDFSATDDTIRLDDAVFAALAPGALDPNAFVTGTAATNADHRIVYDGATGQLFYDADGSGAGAAVLFATLQGAPAVTASDFTVT